VTDPAPDAAPLVDSTLIGAIRLDDAHGSVEFAPLFDITAVEAALISQLFFKLILNHWSPTGGRLDWREYLTRLHPATCGAHVRPLMIHFEERSC
jgi:hypothetical protein